MYKTSPVKALERNENMLIPKPDKKKAAEKIIVALDVDNVKKASALVKELSPLISFFKVGMKLYTACGPRIITVLKKLGIKIFLDLKFHDIPNTVAATAEVVTRLGVEMFNIHLSGGRKMIRATVEAARETANKKGLPVPTILGVTVLSSFDEKMLKEITGAGSLEEHVVRLALLGRDNGLDGVVASPREIGLIRKKCGPEFLTVTPGVRPLWASLDDQSRVLTPRQAFDAGADYLVMGRPIIAHPSPLEAVQKILIEIQGTNQQN
jgi:orotidine-5'-phosphate decarboxylase